MPMYTIRTGHHMTYTAVGIFQGDENLDVTVRVPGFSSRDAASNYAQRFKIVYHNNHLYLNTRDGIEVQDSQVSVHRLKSSKREQMNNAHSAYHKMGLDNAGIALQSIKEFEILGHNELVVTEDDYDIIELPIAMWHTEKGLTEGFGSLAYGVE